MSVFEGYHEYIGGYPECIRDTMIHVGDYHEYIEGNHDKSPSDITITPHCTQPPLMCS